MISFRVGDWQRDSRCPCSTPAAYDEMERHTFLQLMRPCILVSRWSTHCFPTTSKYTIMGFGAKSHNNMGSTPFIAFITLWLMHGYLLSCMVAAHMFPSDCCPLKRYCSLLAMPNISISRNNLSLTPLQALTLCHWVTYYPGYKYKNPAWTINHQSMPSQLQNDGELALKLCRAHFESPHKVQSDTTLISHSLVMSKQAKPS